MQFVGVGFNPIPILAGAAFYASYLWGLWRLQKKPGMPQQLVAYAIILDVFLALFVGGWWRWFWVRLFYPPVPISAYCVIMYLAVANGPQLKNADAVSH